MRYRDSIPSAPCPSCLALVLACVLAAVAGCSPTGRNPEIEQALNQYMYGQFAPASRTLEHYARQTNEDYALNNVRLGSVYLADYDLRNAESAFYRAYEVMNSVHVNDPGRAAGAVLVQERLKVWKGEPYERAMANFYLGLVYYVQHDYNNARAAFENALFKLRDYGQGPVRDDQYREVESDFTIAYIMLGKCWQQLGDEDKANFAFDRAASLRPDLRHLADMSRQDRSNVLLVVDFGMGPAKEMYGDNSVVGFFPDPHRVGPVPPAQVRVDGQPLDLRGLNNPPIDLLTLCQERRWQSIDTIRVFKSVVGTGLMAAGAYEAGRSDNRRNQAAGLAMFAAGALLKASATADLRHWEVLPRCVFILPLRLPPGKHNITVNVGPGATQTWRGIVAPSAGEQTCYMRITGLNNIGPFAWPPSSNQRISRAP